MKQLQQTMEKESSTPLFAVGQEIANFLISCGILSKACEESDLARDSKSFSVTEHEGVAYVIFPSFHKIKGFIVEEGEYGLGNIQTNSQIFSEGLKGNDDKPALVHQGALNLFLRIMEETDFQAKLQIYTDFKQRDLKPIIFVGHSLGGAIATLATLWVLQKRIRQCSPFCITFGCPLVGDERLVEAVGRQKWEGNFLHVISQHDIVPRMFLAPLKSIAQPLAAILPYWHGKIAYSFIQDACNTLLEKVMRCSYTVANYGVDSPLESNGVRKRSPYKPFGSYMFCSSNGAACINDSETVLNILCLTMQLPNNILQDWFSEHTAYGSILNDVINDDIRGRRKTNSNTESSRELGISLQLDALGVEAVPQDDHMWSLLSRALDMENLRNENVAKLAIELSYKMHAMIELERYKGSCENKGGIGYYDSFKKQNGKKDIYADQRRLNLARYWDEIVEMWESHELPSDFRSQNKWINAGTAYRRLLEPLDIANYYRMYKGKGNYLSDGRPNRYKVLQKWLEEKEKTRRSRPRRKLPSLTEDSCFWAHVEEAWKDLENLKQGEEQKLQSLQIFEEYVRKAFNDRAICLDVFLQGSTFMLWWKDWKNYNLNKSSEWSSPLHTITESPFNFESFNSPYCADLHIFCCSRVGEQECFSDEDLVLNSPFFTDEQECSGSNIGQENIPSIGEGKENIPSTKESDLAQLSSKKNELIPQQLHMSDLEWYKVICHEKGVGYYDSFKNRNDNDSSDSKSNLLRVTLNEFWDGIIGMCNSPSLPSDFQSQNKWIINAGTAYRKLVEPLDIAEYYSTSKDSGNYLDRRPPRYKVLEQWLEHRKANRSAKHQKADRTKRPFPFLTRDSCFWAHVEEALKDLKEDSDQKKGSLEKFEGYVAKMIEDGKTSLDVFLEGSSFMKWWRDYKEHQTSEWEQKSPLFKPMKTEFWKS